MGDVVQGVVTGGPYSAAHPSETNKDFVTAFEKVNGGQRPNFMAVFGYDAMHAIYAALQATSGSTDGTKLVDVMKGMSWESPRGPISIDPKTRDAVQNIYMRRVEKQNGQLYNVEFETVPNVRDPAKP
jgi:branched-chain amino acid transport system substrate-binding protein